MQLASESCILTLVIITPDVKLQVLGTPSYVQGESKVHMALQELTTSQTSVSVCCLSYSRLVGLALLPCVLTCTRQISCLLCLLSAHPQIDLVPSAGLPAPTLAPPFLDSTRFLCSHVLNCKPQLFENSVRDFNLVGAVMSRVTLIYKKQPLYCDTMPLSGAFDTPMHYTVVQCAIY